jgi:hypothetical protein
MLILQGADLIALFFTEIHSLPFFANNTHFYAGLMNTLKAFSLF